MSGGQKDSNGGDQVDGDKISTGDIEGVGIAIGTGASVQIYGGVHYWVICHERGHCLRSK